LALVVSEGSKGASKYVWLQSRTVVSPETNHRPVINQSWRSQTVNGLNQRGNVLI
jgi:hypothetical protein